MKYLEKIIGDIEVHSVEGIKNPISYAMMGLLPQMHRDEVTVAKVVSRLLKVTYGIEYLPSNVPNKYLNAR